MTKIFLKADASVKYTPRPINFGKLENLHLEMLEAKPKVRPGVPRVFPPRAANVPKPTYKPPHPVLADGDGDLFAPGSAIQAAGASAKKRGVPPGFGGGKKPVLPEPPDFREMARSQPGRPPGFLDDDDAVSVASERSTRRSKRSGRSSRSGRSVRSGTSVASSSVISDLFSDEADRDVLGDFVTDPMDTGWDPSVHLGDLPPGGQVAQQLRAIASKDRRGDAPRSSSRRSFSRGAFAPTDDSGDETSGSSVRGLDGFSVSEADLSDGGSAVLDVMSESSSHRSGRSSRRPSHLPARGKPPGYKPSDRRSIPPARFVDDGNSTDATSATDATDASRGSRSRSRRSSRKSRQDGGATPPAEPVDTRTPEEIEIEKRRELTTMFKLLRDDKRLPDDIEIPEFDEHADIVIMESAYRATKKEIVVREMVNRYTEWLVLGFWGTERCAGMCGFDMAGYAESQFRALPMYRQLLAEMGEGTYDMWTGLDIPVWMRLAGAIVLSAIIFFTAKKFVGRDEANMAVGFVGDGSLFASMIGGGSTTSAAAPPDARQSARPGRKMRGPDI